MRLPAGLLLLLPLLGGLTGGLVGCVPKSVERPLTDRDPIFVIPAAVEAGKDSDPQQLSELVDLLDSTDAAIRLSAVEALRHRTGKKFGYQFYDDEDERRDAVEQWRTYVDSLGPANRR